ncbi:hypothetical protein [Nonomuraea longicatena]|uniref:Proteinase inhibitor I42 chagasin domain-containing protein n=1 Tax=Nonomuraea longicatena TaxID=83682 RepID=A0ABN1NQK8_9ACTN
MRFRTVAAASLALLLTGCGSGSWVSDHGTVFKGTTGRTVPVELTSGQRFSLAVPAGGTGWSLADHPDPVVASYITEELDGGTAYFVFNAKQKGQTQVQLRDCDPCEGAPAGEAAFQITVK